MRWPARRDDALCRIVCPNIIYGFECILKKFCKNIAKKKKCKSCRQSGEKPFPIVVIFARLIEGGSPPHRPGRLSGKEEVEKIFCNINILCANPAKIHRVRKKFFVPIPREKAAIFKEQSQRLPAKASYGRIERERN